MFDSNKYNKLLIILKCNSVGSNKTFLTHLYQRDISCGSEMLLRGRTSRCDGSSDRYLSALRLV